jgi:hypothetical protein
MLSLSLDFCSGVTATTAARLHCEGRIGGSGAVRWRSNVSPDGHGCGALVL